MRCSVLVSLNRSEFSSDEGSAVVSSLGDDAMPATASVRSRSIGCYVDASSLEDAVEIGLERIQTALGAVGAKGVVTGWRGEQVASSPFGSRRVMIGSSGFAPVRRGRGGDGGGVREPRRPRPTRPLDTMAVRSNDED